MVLAAQQAAGQRNARQDAEIMLLGMWEVELLRPSIEAIIYYLQSLNAQTLRLLCLQLTAFAKDRNP